MTGNDAIGNYSWIGGGDRNDRVPMVGGGDLDDVDVVSRNELAEVTVRGAIVVAVLPIDPFFGALQVF